MSNDRLSRSSESALRERVKELTCLYGIAQLAARPDMVQGEFLQSVVELLPHAWQYPAITRARIAVDGRDYTTAGFVEGPARQSAEILVAGVCRGQVQVIYTEERPELDEGPFLKEERNLIDAVARQVGLLLERREAEQEKSRLQDQLQHADRLATVGVLAASAAHELNEPIGNILGFAQLLKKNRDLPSQVQADVVKIEGASLRVREIIRRLLVFTRQMPPQKARLDLNRVIEEGLHLFAGRCAQGGVELVTAFSPRPLEVVADSVQLNQVLVNLLVNALQAMPHGGRLTVETQVAETCALLVVEDTGIGMSHEVLAKIFTPFFSTKDASQGTGLGLPVVQGIVAAHGGSIRVKSELGQGTRFEVWLPLADAPDVRGRA